jgi:hypothetical protein
MRDQTKQQSNDSWLKKTNKKGDIIVESRLFPVTRPMREKPSGVVHCVNAQSEEDAARLTITKCKKGYLAVTSSNAQSSDGNGKGIPGQKTPVPKRRGMER